MYNKDSFLHQMDIIKSTEATNPTLKVVVSIATLFLEIFVDIRDIYKESNKHIN